MKEKGKSTTSLSALSMLEYVERFLAADEETKAQIEQILKEERPAVKQAKEYAETQNGKRFISSLEKAREFYRKKGRGFLHANQLIYLAYLCDNSFLDGCFDLIALAYCKGYRAAKTSLK